MLANFGIGTLAAHDVAGERLVFSEVQDRVLAPAVDPEAARRIAIARPHGDQTDMRGVVPPGPHIAGDQIALIGDGVRLDRIAAAVLAGEDAIGLLARGDAG